MLESINPLCERPLPNLAEVFDVWWPHLEPKLEKARQSSSSAPAREDRDLLEEILAIVRGVQDRLPPPAPSPSRREPPPYQAAMNNLLRMSTLLIVLGASETDEDRIRTFIGLLPPDAELAPGGGRAIIVRAPEAPPPSIVHALEEEAAHMGLAVAFQIGD